MKKIKVQIKEKDKGVKNLSLLNLRDEVVNFLYKDTVASSTKIDLQFFVLLFFLSIKSKNKLLIENLFDEAIPKFKKLNESFGKKKNFLKSKEYQKLVEESGLTDIFKYDVFFILVEAVLNINEIENRFSSFLEKNEDQRKGVEIIKSKYLKLLTDSMDTFQASRIEDDRYDEYGNYHDLSKSVYRTVRMRNSRNLDLNLQKYTTVKEITSKSPIDLTFFQHIDPQIIFDLWDKYHLAEYVHSISSNIVNGIQNHVDLKINLGDLINGFLIYKITSPKDKKEKLKAQQVFEKAKLKNENNTSVQELVNILVKSVLNANKRLEKELDDTKKQVKKLKTSNIVLQDKDKISKLEARVKHLENLSIQTEIVED